MTIYNPTPRRIIAVAKTFAGRDNHGKIIWAYDSRIPQPELSEPYHVGRIDDPGTLAKMCQPGPPLVLALDVELGGSTWSHMLFADIPGDDQASGRAEVDND